MQAYLVVLDSVGIGAAPDAADYGDEGAHTLARVAEAVGGLSVPCLQAMGLGNIPPQLPDPRPLPGVAAVPHPLAAHGALRERSRGKDTTTGHWELAGIELTEGLRVFPKDAPSFPEKLIRAFESETGRPVLGNKAASGTRVIEALGPRQMKEGAWIVYTSADSVFQIAAHESVVPLEELYRACVTARRLCDPYRIGRVIARPFAGAPGTFQRTENRRDYSMPPPEPTVLDRLAEADVAVTAIGKIHDIFAGRGIRTSISAHNNREVEQALLDQLGTGRSGLVFANLVDFDMLYGHRRDAVGYARALEQTDLFLQKFVARLTPADLLILTADHGNDPGFRGSDHTRELTPLLAYRPGRPGCALGVLDGFFHVAQTLAAWFGIDPLPRGQSLANCWPITGLRPQRDGQEDALPFDCEHDDD